MKAEKERMYEDVKFLTELRPYRNYQNKESLKKVCEHIKQVFLAAGITVREQKWMVGKEEYTNVIGIYQSSPKINGFKFGYCRTINKLSIRKSACRYVGSTQLLVFRLPSFND